MSKLKLSVYSKVATDRTFYIQDAVVVPHVGATMDTPNGLRRVVELHYDFMLRGTEHVPGECKVGVEVDLPYSGAGK
jgi:hypothetical protein